jgi:hypothetical protein
MNCVWFASLPVSARFRVVLLTQCSDIYGAREMHHYKKKRRQGVGEEVR